MIDEEYAASWWSAVSVKHYRVRLSLFWMLRFLLMSTFAYTSVCIMFPHNNTPTTDSIHPNTATFTDLAARADADHDDLTAMKASEVTRKETIERYNAEFIAVKRSTVDTNLAVNTLSTKMDLMMVLLLALLGDASWRFVSASGKKNKGGV